MKWSIGYEPVGYVDQYIFSDPDAAVVHGETDDGGPSDRDRDGA